MLPQFLVTEKALNGRDPAARIEQLRGAGMPEVMEKAFTATRSPATVNLSRIKSFLEGTLRYKKTSSPEPFPTFPFDYWCLSLIF